ncbi:protein kinase domain-containing protein [Candidatus Thiosymbion oneisti]|uniref:ORC-CDC6 family AAA ATPase n=1 Tax=Candidatus Thiosymbion oneisti TaxID=589554 RepID=UPI00105BC8DA|nr:protein kinase family protein [Candidatus Thiosymbion oneisti]
MRKHLPDPVLFLGHYVPGHPRVRVTELINKGNDALVFRAVNESTGYELACRIVPPENLPENKEARQEWLEAAKRISNEVEHSAAVPCQDDLLWEVTDDEKTYVAFLFPFIKGRNLRDYVKNNRNEITIPFIEKFLVTMFELLYAMQQRKIEHGDLHAGNVIVADPAETAIEPEYSFKIIDFGVHHVTSSVGGQSDYHRIAEMLRLLLGTMDRNGPEISAQDKYIWDILRDEFLARHLIEDDPLIDQLARNPRKLYSKIRDLRTAYQRYVEEREQTGMVTPFDYPNCEQMGNLHLLLDALYSDRFLGLSQIEARTNLVLTGPRGCGKTTVFRALSLQHKLKVGKDQPDNLSYIGIYYRCDDLYFAFPRFRRSEIPEAIDIPMHFLIASLVRETLVTIQGWARKHFSEDFRRIESQACRRLWQAFDLKPPQTPDAMQFDSLIARLQKERSRATRKYPVQHDPKQGFGRYFGPQYLKQVCQVLKEEFGFLLRHPFYFFIDDYSDPKITTDLQENLNRLVMHRDSDCYFKISTESPVSFVPRDIDGKSYVETREYDLLNLGIRYIRSGVEDKLPFLDSLFERRFRKVQNYSVTTLDELIGDKKRNENELARQLRDRVPNDTYSGRTTLAALCSGDIHYMIRLVGSMVAEIGGVDALKSREQSPKIDYQEQHRVVKKNAGEFLNSVRMLPEVGQRLADIVTAFGNVARSYLKYRTSKNQTGKPPYQAIRIEPYESFELHDEAAKILKALLRYSIFLEDPRGKSRRGQIVPRYHLRRYLIPKLNLTLSGRDSIPLKSGEIEQLLTDPKKFEDQKRIRGPEDRQRMHNPDEEGHTKDLLSDLN